jgi:hypothetical protein
MPPGGEIDSTCPGRSDSSQRPSSLTTTAFLTRSEGLRLPNLITQSPSQDYKSFLIFPTKPIPLHTTPPLLLLPSLPLTQHTSPSVKHITLVILMRLLLHH